MQQPRAVWGEHVRPRHGYRREVIGRIAVAELPEVVAAPAVHGASGRNAACVQPADARGGESSATRCQDWGRAEWLACSITELAIAVVAPAVDGATGRQPATVHAVGADRSECQFHPEGVTRHGREASGLSDERVATPRLVDREVRERRYAGDRIDGTRSSQRTALWRDREGDRNGIRGARDRVATCVLDRHTNRGRENHCSLRGRRRLSDEGESPRRRGLSSTVSTGAQPDSADSDTVGYDDSGQGASHLDRDGDADK